jgi:hypothetical protein
MPQMLKTPIIGPPRDCQGVQTWSRWREVMSLQYWHWFEDLERFARNHSDLHLQACKDFNRRVGPEGRVGIRDFPCRGGEV